MKKLKARASWSKKAIGSLFASYAILPVLALAQAKEPSALVPDCRGVDGVRGACGYSDFVTLGQSFLEWAIYLAVLGSIVAFVWAGFLYLSSAGDSGKISRAHKTAWTAVKGIVITMAAWLIVKSILDWMGIGNEWTFLS